MATPSIKTRLTSLREQLADETGGELASYIPELHQANPDWFGLATTTATGITHAAGEKDREFSIQSVSKPFVYAMALMDRGEEVVLDHVGIEPTGDPFNAVTLASDTGKPLNPMVNAGAIVTSTLVNGADHRQRTERIRLGLSAFAGRELSIDDNVARSEHATSDRNRAISYLMRGAGSLTTDVEDALSCYIAQCSVLITVQDLSVMAATLAAGGRNPLTGEQVIPTELIAPVLTIMSTCGMYDGAGQWMYRVGLPAKSGVSGAIMAVLPNQLGFATWSPPLDRHGNSVRGVKAMEQMAKDFDLHVFYPTGIPSSPLRLDTTGQCLRSRTGRSPAEDDILAQHGHLIRIVELQGSVGLLGAYDVVSCLTDDKTVEGGWLVVDVRHVTDVHPGALTMINKAAHALTRRGVRVEMVESQRRNLDQVSKSWVVPVSHNRDTVLDRCEDAVISTYAPDATKRVSVDLHDCQILVDLSSEQLATVASLITITRVQAGEVIVQPDVVPNGVTWLLEGEVDIYLDVSGPVNSTRLAGIAPGTVLGEAALVDDSFDRGGAVATQDSSVAHLSSTAWDRLQKENPDIAGVMLRGVARLLAQRQRRLVELVESMVGTHV